MSPSEAALPPVVLAPTGLPDTLEDADWYWPLFPHRDRSQQFDLVDSPFAHRLRKTDVVSLCTMSESAEFREAEAASSPQISQYVRGTCEVRRGNEAGLDLVLSSFHQSTGVEAEAIRNDAIGLAVILHSKTARAWMHDAGFDNVSDLDALASYFYQTGDRPAGDALVQELIRTDVGLPRTRHANEP